MSCFNYNDDYFPLSEITHGTKVAGMVKQIAPNADIISMGVEATRDYECVKGQIAALYYLYNHFTELQPDIISISYNSEKPIVQSIENNFTSICSKLMYEKGVLFTISVDNSAIDLSGLEIYGSMGNYPQAIGVGICYDEGENAGVRGVSAYNGDDEMDLEILAPGINVTSALYCNQSGSDLEYYLAEGISGTSFATPIVAGAVALIKAHNEVTAYELENLVKKFAIPGFVFEPSHDEEYYFKYYGNGILNIAGALGFGDWDNDGLTDEQELSDEHSTSPWEADEDGDGLLDGEEYNLGTDPFSSDTDSDGLNDWEEVNPGTDNYITNPLDADSDNDNLTDGEEQSYGTNPNDSDTDDDNLSDYEETQIYHTNPNDNDTDGDLLLDDWEVFYGTNPNLNDANIDYDTDGLTNLQEQDYGTDPFNSDTDFDWLNDGDEINVYHTNPINGDTDGDYLPDGWEVLHGYSPVSQDSDGDGTLDLNEDEDGDGLTVIEELAYGTLDTDSDTDGDCIPDYDEIH
ncbi:MAG: S8 family serine peptidase, partial [Candidatus Heimdallarchaeota archaeon]|nr:S8 family serine peptidase [Candidatus Heimdallarchaeota archaeon]